MATNVEDLRKRANETGLVPCRIVRPFMPYVEGQVAGFTPEQAAGYIDLNYVELYTSRRGDAKNVMLGMTGPEPGSHDPVRAPGPHVADTRLTRYDRRPEVTPRAQTAPVTTLEPNAPVRKTAEIPDGWEDWPSSEKRRIAADLSGRSYQELNTATSEEIIRAAVAGEEAPPRVESNLDHGEVGTTEGAGSGPVGGADAD